MRPLLTLLTLCCLLQVSPAISQSVLSTGSWYKFAVEKEGIYKLTYSDLQNVGIAVSQLNPKSIRLYGNKGGMLPQSIDSPRPFDLTELSIKIVGEGDGKFDAGDYIIFYAHGADKVDYNSQLDLYNYESNLYSEKNFYYLTFSGQEGKRLSSIPDLGSAHSVISSYDSIFYLEEEDLNVLQSGRKWFGRLSNNNLIVQLPFQDLHSNGTIKVHAALMAQSTAASSFTLSINNVGLGTVGMDTIRNYNLKNYLYTERGKLSDVVFSANQDDIVKSNEGYVFNLKYNPASTDISRGYYDKIMIQAELPLRFNSPVLIFSSSKSLQNGISTFQVTTNKQDLLLWNISDHNFVQEQEFSFINGKIIFGAISSEFQRYAVFDPSLLNKPEFIGTVENQDIKSNSTPDLLIVSHEAFLSEANRLAQFRRDYNGYSVLVASTNEIYNEFSSGKTEITAIRNFIKHLYDKDPNKLKYVLLVGKGSYDYQNHNGVSNSFVPIYESRNSLHPLRSYSSDDFYGFMESHEGEWAEESSEEHTLELSIGRFPVTTVEEARQVVDKYINYSNNASNLGDWRTKILFVADDGDNNLHNKQAEDLADYIDATVGGFEIKKLYLDNYKQQTAPTGQVSPEAKKALQRHIEDGKLIINFTGHGGTEQWTDEKIFDNELIESLKNYDRLPLFVTATCAFGRQDNPRYKSGAEKLLLNPKGGAIALVTTSRDVYSSSNFLLNNEFYKAYQLLQNEVFTVGDLFKLTKNNAIKGVDNRNFSLIGDPSMVLGYPQLKVNIDNTNLADTLKSLQYVTLKGTIIGSDGDVVKKFNGEANLVITDKPRVQKTRGDEYEASAPFSYKAKDNYIFRGISSVQEGHFEASFVVPADIDHKIGSGELMVYAYDRDNNLDAAGSNTIAVGGTAPGAFDDHNGPQINIFMEDTTFQNGDVVGSDALLLIKFHDDSGINISGRSYNSEITAEIGDKRVVLNEYYKSLKDDYKSGWVVYPVEDLVPGNYLLTVSASDIYNNSTIETVEFTVTDQDQFDIVELFNAPNPVTSNTSFYYMHNRAGEAMEGELTIYNSQGSKIMAVDFTTETGQVRHKIFEWDCRNPNGKKIEPGIYYYHVNLRSNLDGTKAGKFQKLIIRN